MNSNPASKSMPEELPSKILTGSLLDSLDEAMRAAVLESHFTKSHSLRKMSYTQQLNNPQWKAKRLSILERDDYSCKLCGSTDKLHVHHIKYTGKAWEAPDENLITLCSCCHKIVHKKNITIIITPTLDGIIVIPEDCSSSNPLEFEFDLSKVGATEEDMPYLLINRYGDTGEFFIVDLRAWGYKAKKPWEMEI